MGHMETNIHKKSEASINWNRWADAEQQYMEDLEELLPSILHMRDADIAEKVSEVLGVQEDTCLMLLRESMEKGESTLEALSRAYAIDRPYVGV